MSECVKTRGCGVRLHMRMRRLCGVCCVARQAHIHALLWCMRLTQAFVTGDSVRSHCDAPRVASRGQLPNLRDRVTPLPPVTLCRPTTSAWQGDSRALAHLTPLEEKATLSFCRDAHDTAWVLHGVTPDSDCPWHPCSQPAYTHPILGSMSE